MLGLAISLAHATCTPRISTESTDDLDRDCSLPMVAVWHWGHCLSDFTNKSFGQACAVLQPLGSIVWHNIWCRGNSDGAVSCLREQARGFKEQECVSLGLDTGQTRIMSSTHSVPTPKHVGPSNGISAMCHTPNISHVVLCSGRCAASTPV